MLRPLIREMIEAEGEKPAEPAPRTLKGMITQQEHIIDLNLRLLDAITRSGVDGWEQVRQLETQISKIKGEMLETERSLRGSTLG